jgi:transcriptional regulator with XRE-family HTH domain
MPLAARKDGARALGYALPMTGEKQQDQELAPEPKRFAKNLAILMRWRGWNQSDLGRQSGVSQRHISDILRGHSDCTTDMAEQLAKAFGMHAWQLMVEDVTEEVLTSTDLKILVDSYLRYPQGRKLLMGAADMVREGPTGR